MLSLDLDRCHQEGVLVGRSQVKVKSTGSFDIAEPKKNIYISRTMFFNRYITLSLPHYGLLLAGLLLRHAR